MAFFKDLGRAASDLLNRGWVSTEGYNYKIEATTTAPNGFSAVPSIQKSNDDTIRGSVKTTIPLRELGANITATANLNQDLTVEVSSDRYINDLAKPTLEVSTKTQFQKYVLNPTIDFRPSAGAGVTIGGIFEYPYTSNPTFNASFSISRKTAQGFNAFGADTQYTSGVDPQVNVATSFVTSTLTSTVFGTLNFGKLNNSIVGANFVGPLGSSPTTNIATELQYDLSGKKTQISLGASTKPDPSSTLKGRITSKGIFGLAYTQNLNGPFTVTLLSDIDVLDVNSPNSFKYGVKVSIA